MAQYLTNPPQQNYYFKESIAYTEDHIPVKKIYLYKVPPELNQNVLEEHFNVYGRVLRMQIFRPRNAPRGCSYRSHRRFTLTGYVFFANAKDAAKALQGRIHHINGRKFHVQASDSWHQPDAYIPRHPPVVLPTMKPSPPSPIFVLNDHCLEHILKYLPLTDQIHFARACARFRSVYQMASPRLHKRVDLCHFDEMTVWDMRDFFRISGSHVHQIEGVMPTARTQRFCDFLSSCCPNLKSMMLLSSPLNSRNMNKLFSKMHSLETLYMPMSNLTDGGILSLRHMRNLKTLNVSWNAFSGYTLSKLTAPIESLFMNECLSFQTFELAKICKKFDHLKELSITNMNTSYSNTYQALVKENACPNLEILRMTAFEGDNYEFIAQLPSLKHLTVYPTIIGHNSLREELFEQLAEHKAQQLQRLEIHGTTLLSRETMTQISKLTELRRILLPRIETDSVLDELSNLQNLEQITIQQSANTSGSSILHLFGACPKLNEILLDGYVDPCDKLVLGIVARVRQETANKEMRRKLPIKLCVFIQDTMIEDLLENSKLVPKDIIQVKCSSQRDYDLTSIDFVNLIGDEFDFDPDDMDLAEDSGDDESDYFEQRDLFDAGYLGAYLGGDFDEEASLYDFEGEGY
ncbi:uncharacterized protein Dana_GF13243 [Drosophila ananassae]|uniref:RRM domain-containing protein n=1 Tax=Drosophila ananassae TaxID=7217 RepID=B3MIG1_DROAN|nr:uncharacterized protein LOC6496085 [Drosophila ananassae]EDV37009.2 uncharacterized protein Dana_GF13243 [Drosophila ananassae]